MTDLLRENPQEGFWDRWSARNPLSMQIVPADTLMGLPERILLKRTEVPQYDRLGVPVRMHETILPLTREELARVMAELAEETPEETPR